MAQAIKTGGGFSRCLSTNVSGWQDVSKRWGATALIDTGTTAAVKAWSVSPAGVVTWDAKGVDASGNFVAGNDVAMNWDTAVAACATSGGRLPTVEELKTLGDARCEALGSADCTVDSARNPPGFQASYYWSGTELPSGPSGAYVVRLDVGYMNAGVKTDAYYVHCVR